MRLRLIVVSFCSCTVPTRRRAGQAESFGATLERRLRDCESRTADMERHAKDAESKTIDAESRMKAAEVCVSVAAGVHMPPCVRLSDGHFHAGEAWQSRQGTRGASASKTVQPSLQFSPVCMRACLQARSTDAEKRSVDCESRLAVSDRRLREAENQLAETTHRWVKCGTVPADVPYIGGT